MGRPVLQSIRKLRVSGSILSDHGCWERIRPDVKRLPKNEEARRALEPEEERMFLESASAAGRGTPRESGPALHRNSVVAEYRNAHKEIRTLRWKDMDLESGVLRVSKARLRGVHQFVHQPGRALQSTLPN